MDKPLVSLSVLFVPLASLSTLGKKLLVCLLTLVGVQMFFCFSMSLAMPLAIVFSTQKKDFQCLFKCFLMLGNKTKQNKYFAHFLVSFNMFPNALNVFPNTLIILQHPSCCPPTPFNNHHPQLFSKLGQGVP
jgi:hypothetical protein